MIRLIAIACVVGSVVGCAASPNLRDVNVPAGAPTQAFTVYWLDRTTCTSRLRSVKSVTVVSGEAEGLAFALEPSTSVVPFQCPSRTMPGAHVTVRQTRPFGAQEIRQIAVQVEYDTVDGPRSSSHSARFIVAPGSR